MIIYFIIIIIVWCILYALSCVCCTLAGSYIIIFIITKRYNTAAAISYCIGTYNTATTTVHD